jgi:transcriptional regulator with PAS, ATPase and Fis domain
VDLPILIGHILRRLSAAGDRQLPEVSEKVMEILLNYRYPGNVRELENILEHALIICQEKTIQPRHLPEYLQIRRIPRKSTGKKRFRPLPASDAEEREKIISVLQQHNGHRTRTAEALGMERTTLWRKIKKYGIIP